jgi:hypothetical protein
LDLTGTHVIVVLVSRLALLLLMIGIHQIRFLWLSRWRLDRPSLTRTSRCRGRACALKLDQWQRSDSMVRWGVTQTHLCRYAICFPLIFGSQTHVLLDIIEGYGMYQSLLWLSDHLYSRSGLFLGPHIEPTNLYPSPFTITYPYNLVIRQNRGRRHHPIA